MSDRVIECASRAGRDFSEFMKGEKGMMEALASVDEFGEQLRLNGCVNHHFVSYMMRNSIMQAFMDMANIIGRIYNESLIGIVEYVLRVKAHPYFRERLTDGWYQDIP